MYVWTSIKHFWLLDIFDGRKTFMKISLKKLFSNFNFYKNYIWNSWDKTKSVCTEKRIFKAAQRKTLHGVKFVDLRNVTIIVVIEEKDFRK